MIRRPSLGVLTSLNSLDFHLSCGVQGVPTMWCQISDRLSFSDLSSLHGSEHSDFIWTGTAPHIPKVLPRETKAIAACEPSRETMEIFKGRGNDDLNTT